MDKKKRNMPLKEFMDAGYLQELNRRFLHPLGLMMEFDIDKDTGEVKFGRIYDYRDDLEGIIFAEELTKEEDFIKKAKRIQEEIERRFPIRSRRLGSFIQPIGEAKQGV